VEKQDLLDLTFHPTLH